MSKKDRNEFGGGNANSAYVPMTDLEQEVLARLIGSGDITMRTSVGQPTVQKVTFGDKRVQVTFGMVFDGIPAPGRPLPFLDLCLQTQAGLVLYRERQPTAGMDGKPLMVAETLNFTMIWDIAIHHMDPALVKAVVPGALGMTSRLQDRDTGNITLSGNMRDLTPDKVALLKAMAAGEKALKRADAAKLADLAKSAKA